MSKINSLSFWVIIITAAIILPAAAQLPVQFGNQELDRDLSVVQNLQRVGKFKDALDYLGVLKVKFGEDPRIASLYKSIYTDAKMYPELETQIREEIAKSPQNPLPLAELGNVRYLRDDPKGADSLWNLALKMGEKNQAVYIYVANYKLRYGDYEGAIQTFLKGRKEFNIPDIFSSDLANIYEAQRNYPAAVNEYLNRLVISPNRFLSISPKILELVEDSESVDDIIAAIKKKIDENKNVDVLYEVLGDVYITRNDMKNAFETYRIMGKGSNDDGQSLYRFAERCLDFKAYATAAQAVDEYLAKSKRLSRKDQALLLKGEALKREGKTEEARTLLLDLYNSTIDLSVKSHSGFLMGQISSDKNDCSGATDIWRNAIKLTSDPLLKNKMIYESARCEIKLGDYNIADSLLKIIGDQETGDEIRQSALFLLAELNLFRGKYADARDGYVYIIKSFPRSDYANDAVARMTVISTLGIDNSGFTADNKLMDSYAKALENRMLGKYDAAATILLSPDMEKSAIGENAFFLAGNIYAEAGMNDKAINIYKSYIDKYPDGFFADRVYLAMGDIYRENPQTADLARDSYNRILEAFQEGPVTELARERLRSLESQKNIG